MPLLFNNAQNHTRKYKWKIKPPKPNHVNKKYNYSKWHLVMGRLNKNLTVFSVILLFIIDEYLRNFMSSPLTIIFNQVY